MFVFCTQACSLALVPHFRHPCGGRGCGTCSHHGVEPSPAQPSGAPGSAAQPRCPLSPKTHPQGRAPEHLLCSSACVNQIPPAERLLPLGLLPKHVRAMQNRILLTTHQNHANTVTSHIPMGTSRPALTCLIQQLVKRRAGTTGGLPTTTALLGSVYFNPSTFTLQHF